MVGYNLTKYDDYYVILTKSIEMLKNPSNKKVLWPNYLSKIN